MFLLSLKTITAFPSQLPLALKHVDACASVWRPVLCEVVPGEALFHRVTESGADSRAAELLEDEATDFVSFLSQLDWAWKTFSSG